MGRPHLSRSARTGSAGGQCGLDAGRTSATARSHTVEPVPAGKAAPDANAGRSARTVKQAQRAATIPSRKADGGRRR
eukprot:1670898-Rhodomonas_salina.1